MTISKSQETKIMRKNRMMGLKCAECWGLAGQLKREINGSNRETSAKGVGSHLFHLDRQVVVLLRLNSQRKRRKVALSLSSFVPACCYIETFSRHFLVRHNKISSLTLLPTPSSDTTLNMVRSSTHIPSLLTQPLIWSTHLPTCHLFWDNP